MDTSLFYFDSDFSEGQSLILPTETSKHCVTVLRMQVGAELLLTNGRGDTAMVKIVLADKYKTKVEVVEVRTQEQRTPQLVLAIGFTRNKNRNEWLLEKAVEIGVDYIIPLQCFHSERDKFNAERANAVMIAALIQSKQSYLPTLLEQVKPIQAIDYFQKNHDGAILIAHCEPSDKTAMWDKIPQKTSMIMIGPEGDFSTQEIEDALAMGALPISLGPNRLRTETAAIYACTIFNQKNYAL